MDDKGRLCLTDIFKASGKDHSFRPSRWLSWKDTQEFIQAVDSEEKGRGTSLLEKTYGRNGATFGHWQLALAYAKYLSPQMHMEVNKTYMRYKAADPNLALEVIDKQKDVALCQRVQPDIG